MKKVVLPELYTQMSGTLLLFSIQLALVYIVGEEPDLLNCAFIGRLELVSWWEICRGHSLSRA